MNRIVKLFLAALALMAWSSLVITWRYPHRVTRKGM